MASSTAAATTDGGIRGDSNAGDQENRKIFLSYKEDFSGLLTSCQNGAASQATATIGLTTQLDGAASSLEEAVGCVPPNPPLPSLWPLDRQSIASGIHAMSARVDTPQVNLRPFSGPAQTGRL